MASCGATPYETTVSITDDDTAGVNISESSLEIEEGASAGYTVVLTSEPVGDVTVTMEDAAGTDLSLGNAILTFTALDWSIPQTVTVMADHDDDAVADPVATITHTPSSAADANYEGLSAGDVEVIVVEDDRVGITVIPPRVYYDEGTSYRFSFHLNSQPIANVTLQVATAGGPRSFEFTPRNWNTPQTFITVTLPHDTDTIDDVYTYFTYPSSGGNYEGVLWPLIYVTQIDDDPVMRYTLSEVGSVDGGCGHGAASRIEGGDERRWSAEHRLSRDIGGP